MSEHQPITHKPWFFGLLIVAILGSAVLISRYLISSAPVAERKAPQRVARLVAATTLEQTSERVRIAAYGAVEAAQRSTLAARVGGEVVEVSPAFVPGNRVSEGTVLLRLESIDYELAVAEAQAALATARASLAQEQGNQAVARADAAIVDLQVSDEEQRLMLREPQLLSAEASVQSAESALERAKLNLARTTIRAPFDGVVLSRDVSLGAQASAGSGVGEMVAASPYWVTLRVPVDALRWVDWPDQNGQGGSSVELVDAGDPHSPRWQGRVLQLLDTLEEQGRRAGVLVEVDQPQAGDRPLLLGTYVQATIHGREVKQALRLDTTWVHDGKVWKIDDDRLAAQPVEIAYRASDHILVSAGLNNGDRIVTSVPSGFVDGMRVRIQGDVKTPSRDAALPPAGPRP